MVRSKSDVWNYFETEGNKTICKFCRKEAFKNPSRMPVHLIKCSKCPESVKMRMSSTISKSCVSLCKRTPIFKSLESKLETSSEHFLANSSDTEEPDFDQIDDIEVLSEEDVETNRMHIITDGKYRHGNADRISDSWCLKKNNDMNRLHTKKSDEVVLDEFSMFGDCVAHKLRNINNPRARAIAQYYINTVLFRAEMTNFKEEVPHTSSQEFKLFDAVQATTDSSELDGRK